ncbi:DUF4276 family protein [bacterium]|nr:DUF4276 family protein [bacterium]
MHIEILVEDSSGKKLLDSIIPKILGPLHNEHTWRLHAYRGIGRLPRGLKPGGDPRKRILLDQVPRIIQGYGKTPGIDAVVVVLDSDRKDCASFLAELKAMAASCQSPPNTIFRLAIEEMEAWYFGDPEALLVGYPRARQEVLARYIQDSVCATWEMLADAVYPGGVAAVKKVGWPLPGQLKHEWAEKIGPWMDPERNQSPSFAKLRDGLRSLLGAAGSEL